MNNQYVPDVMYPQNSVYTEVQNHQWLLAVISGDSPCWLQITWGGLYAFPQGRYQQVWDLCSA